MQSASKSHTAGCCRRRAINPARSLKVGYPRITSLNLGSRSIGRHITKFCFSQPSDDGPLQERLDKWLATMREAYEHEAGNWRKEINRLTTATLVELGLATEDERAKRVKETEAQLGIIESETPIGGVPCKGRLKLTVEDVKRGLEGIRDAWMQEDWAKKNSEDLELMARERRRFRKWLVTHRERLPTFTT